MEIFRIGLDFDGVVANTPLLKSIVAKEVFNLDVSPQDMLASYIIEKNLMNIDSYHQLQQEIYFEHPEWHKKLSALEGALKGIRTLQGDGHAVHCVTSRTPEAVSLAKQWVEENCVDIEVHDTEGHPDKNEVIMALSLDVFVDDDPQYLKPLIGLVPHLLLYSWKYNEGYDEEESITRTRSWSDILARVHKLAKKEK